MKIIGLKELDNKIFHQPQLNGTTVFGYRIILSALHRMHKQCSKEKIEHKNGNKY